MKKQMHEGAVAWMAVPNRSFSGVCSEPVLI